MSTRLFTKAPAGYEFVLAVWPYKTNPLERMGEGTNYAAQGDSCGTARFFIRLFNTNDGTFCDTFAVRPLADAVRDLALRVFFYADNSYRPSADWLGHDIFLADSARLYQVAKLIDTFNGRAAKLYVGGTESIEHVVRRALVGAGVNRAVRIERDANTYKTTSLDSAIDEFVMPAVQHVSLRLRSTP